MVHCLRISSSTAGNVGSIPGQGTKIPHVWDPTVWPTTKKMKLEMRSRRRPVGPASGCHGGCLPFSLYPTLETVEPPRALYSSQDSEGLPVWGSGKARERYPCQAWGSGGRLGRLPGGGSLAELIFQAIDRVKYRSSETRPSA